MMYEHLIRELREASTPTPGSIAFGRYSACEGYISLIKRAADVIEELSDTLKAYQDGTDMVVEEVPGKMAIRFVEKWIPVTDRLPDPNVDVLVYANGSVGIDKYFGLILDKPSFFKRSYRVTHWMPLPKAPELSKED